MINANELRIGNWVFINDKTDCYGKVYQIDGHEIYGHSGFISVKYKDPEDSRCTNQMTTNKFEPIYLTWEVLIRCGFTKHNSPKYREHLEYYEDKNGVSMEWRDGLFTITNDCYDNKLIIKIKYLHELQNIYKAVTKKELEINFD